MIVSRRQIRDFVMPWLDRVALQLEPRVKEAEKNYDYQTSRRDLEASKILGLIISASRPPSYHQTGLFNTHTVTHHHHHTHVATPSSSEPAKNKIEKREKEVSWKNIVVLTFICTAITSISVFIYTRLGKKEEKANNYLEKTNMVKQFAETLVFTDENTHSLREVANVQQKIDQNALDKIKGYKRATLAALIGTVTATAGAIAMPWFAIASTVSVIAGMTITAGSVVYATYNLASHWDDATEAKEGLTKIQQHLTRLRTPQNFYYTEDFPPAYAESQRQYGCGYVATEATAPIYPEIPDNWKS